MYTLDSISGPGAPGIDNQLPQMPQLNMHLVHFKLRPDLGELSAPEACPPWPTHHIRTGIGICVTAPAQAPCGTGGNGPGLDACPLRKCKPLHHGEVLKALRKLPEKSPQHLAAQGIEGSKNRACAGVAVMGCRLCLMRDLRKESAECRLRKGLPMASGARNRACAGRLEAAFGQPCHGAAGFTPLHGVV